MSIVLLRAKRKAINELDQLAVQLMYTTKGMEALYYIKHQQALAVMTNILAVAPYVTAEAEATGVTKTQAAIVIINAAESLHSIRGPAIEKIRRAGKQAIRSGNTLSDVQTAYAQASQNLLVWE